MELIVDGKNVLEPVNLDKNKNEIMRQRASVPSQVSLTHFKENVGFFKANVKGECLNGLVTELQKTFSDINTRETKMYDQLDTVFKTVESIHKGSIEGIIVGVKSAQEAISQAEYAIETITETLVILQEFKNQLEENTEHLNDIDIIWDATQQLDKDVQRLEKTLAEKAKKFDENIKVLMSLKSMLDKIKHIKDVDLMYKDLSALCKNFEQEKKNTNGCIDSISGEVQQLQGFKATIEKIEHLSAVDEMFITLENLKNSVSEEKNRVSQEHSMIRDDIQKLVAYRQLLEKIEHLREVDTLWSNSEEQTRGIATLEQTMESNCQRIDDVEETIRHNVEEISDIQNELLRSELLEKEVNSLKEKVKILHYALGGTVGLVVVQIILNMIGIL